MKIKIEEKQGKLYVHISIPSTDTGAPRQRVISRDVKKILQEKKVKYGKCIDSPTVTNRRNEQCSGTFIFEIPKPTPKPKPVVPQTRTRRAPSRRKKLKNEENT